MRQICLKPANIIQPIFNQRLNVFKRKPIVLSSKYTRWRKVAKLINLSHDALLRLEWMIFYYTAGQENASLTAKHFGISRNCLHEWLKRFKKAGQNVRVLESKSSRPHRVRTWEVTLQEEVRIKQLREKYIHWGKRKIRRLYQRIYHQDISTWKIERVIRYRELYPEPVKVQKIAIKRKRNRLRPKKRIQELTKEPILWFLLQLDGITIYWNGLKRYILTAVDHAGKVGFARMYKNKSSTSAADFLYRLQYFINQPIINLQTDNGSEFAASFNKATQKLGIQRYFSRVKMPTDNPEVERFNQTLEYEWLYDGNFTPDCDKFNRHLTKWLIEYNFERPHDKLDLQTPIEYTLSMRKVSPTWSACTRY